jgi:hypothetical protein
MIRIRVRQVGHAMLFDQMACARQHLHQSRDDLVEQAPQLIAAGGTAYTLQKNRRTSAWEGCISTASFCLYHERLVCSIYFLWRAHEDRVARLAMNQNRCPQGREVCDGSARH